MSRITRLLNHDQPSWRHARPLNISVLALAAAIGLLVLGATVTHTTLAGDGKLAPRRVFHAGEKNP